MFRSVSGSIFIDQLELLLLLLLLLLLFTVIEFSLGGSVFTLVTNKNKYA